MLTICWPKICVDLISRTSHATDLTFCIPIQPSNGITALMTHPFQVQCIWYQVIYTLRLFVPFPRMKRRFNFTNCHRFTGTNIPWHTWHIWEDLVTVISPTATRHICKQARRSLVDRSCSSPLSHSTHHNTLKSHRHFMLTARWMDGIAWTGK
jgi:hypothetical protein